MQKNIIFILLGSAVLFSKVQKIWIDAECYVKFPGNVTRISSQQAGNFLASKLRINRDNRPIFHSFDHSNPTTVYCTTDSLLISLSFKKNTVKNKTSVALDKEMIDSSFRLDPKADSNYSSHIENIHGDSVLTINNNIYGIENLIALYSPKNQKFRMSLRLWCLPAEKTKAKMVLNQLIHSITFKE